MYKDILEELCNSIDFEINDGIEADIKGFFRGDDTIEDFKIDIFRDKIYDIYILLKNPCEYENEKKFFEFMQFMQHPKLNLYYKTTDDIGKRYIFISATENLTGFYCEIHFG